MTSPSVACFEQQRRANLGPSHGVLAQGTEEEAAAQEQDLRPFGHMCHQWPLHETRVNYTHGHTFIPCLPCTFLLVSLKVLRWPFLLKWLCAPGSSVIARNLLL